MTKLLLVRHGQSEANRLDLFAGFYDAKLEPHGETQAKVTARYIKENYHVDAVYASDLQRAYKTGQIIAEYLDVPIVAERGLREIDGGEWEGKYFHGLIDLYPEDFGLWQTDLAKARCTGGESVRQLTERIMSTLARIAQEDPEKTLVIATHATPIRAAMTMIQHGTLEQMQYVPWVSNASVTELHYEEGTWQCVHAGADHHLEGLRTVLSKSV